MTPDELRQPLRRRSLKEKLRGLRPSALMTASVVVFGCFAAAGVWAVKTNPENAGEPVVTVKIERVDPIVTSSVQTAPEPDEADADAGIEDVPYDPSLETIDLDLSNGGDQQEAALIQPRRQSLVAAPLKSVSERGPHGLLPKISRKGKKPWLVYGAKVDTSTLRSTTPKVAIVLGGMGINSKLTLQAINDLPSEVTLAFAPYGKRLQSKINEARAAGHEVMLQLPMEPFGYPAVDPGPRTLLASADSAKTLDDLKWHMSRFSGYTGVVNYLGAKFTSEGENFAPVLRELKARGLIYLDDGTSQRSMAGALGQVVGVPVRTAVEVIDSDASYNSVSAALARLEEIAARDGQAIGVGTGLAVTLDALASWARDLSARNVLLVPASALYRPKAG